MPHPSFALFGVTAALSVFIVATAAAQPKVVRLKGGVTYLADTLSVGACDEPTVIEGAPDGSSVLSGAEVVRGLVFRPSTDAEEAKRGVRVATWRPQYAPDQLFVNGVRYVLARYPNRQPGERRNVYDVWELGLGKPGDQDALAPARIGSWRHPEDGFLHAMHAALWGDMHWRIRGRNSDGTLKLEGGWQNNRPSAPHPVYRYVENLREELDAPGEWFYDCRSQELAIIPPPDVDLASATIESVRLRELLSIRGTAASPVRDVIVRNVTFRQSARTFMDNRERLLRSDWTLCRSGAVTVANAENVRFENCRFLDLGGNALVIDGFAAKISAVGSLFREIGASGVVVAGRVDAVRSPLFDYNASHDLSAVDRTPGPASENYPRDCLVDDCLFIRTGREEKQTAAVTVDIAARVTVRDCTIAAVPRAGVNIGDGCFGGHLVEGCDVFDTVLETGDHGAFNGWGRDRFWAAELEKMDGLMDRDPALVGADCVARNVLRDNRWRCDHGWDIDLDDGCSFYDVVSNVCLRGGIKLREGFRRVVTGNFCANNGVHPHCWLQSGGDVVEGNVFFAPPAPAGRGDFIDLGANRNTYVAPGEEARHPLPTARRFGVRSERLRRLAPQPRQDELKSFCRAQAERTVERRKVRRQVWRRFDAPREFSAFGVSVETVGWVLEAGAEAPFEKGDLLLDELSALEGDSVKIVRRQRHLSLDLR